jgi:hypothetical protein
MHRDDSKQCFKMDTTVYIEDDHAKMHLWDEVTARIKMIASIDCAAQS